MGKRFPGTWPAGAALWILLMAGCGQSEEDVRTMIRTEMAERAVRTHITDAQTIGPYSPAVRAGNFLFVSGQIALDPETQRLVSPEIEIQTRQVLTNLGSILRKAGYDSSHVVHCTIYLKNIGDFQRMNLIYGGYFPEDAYPARATVEVSDLPRNALIELSAIAYKEE